MSFFIVGCNWLRVFSVVGFCEIIGIEERLVEGNFVSFTSFFFVVNGLASFIDCAFGWLFVFGEFFLMICVGTIVVLYEAVLVLVSLIVFDFGFLLVVLELCFDIKVLIVWK